MKRYIQASLSKQAAAAMQLPKSSERRSALARIMYNARAGEEITLPTGVTLTKLGDAPGDIWESSRGLRQFGDDWVKELAHERIKASKSCVSASSDAQEELVDLLAQTTDGEWVTIFENIPESQALAIWRAGFKTGENRFSVENERGRQVAKMNRRAMRLDE